MIEKTLASINNENMVLLQRWKEIMKVQSELIKEKKLLDSKVDSNILQKLCLEKRKMILFPIVEVPVASTSETSSPENSVTKSPCIIKRAIRSLLGDLTKGTSNLESNYCRVKFLIVVCCRYLENLMKLNKM